MVCAACEKKLTKVACPEPWRVGQPDKKGESSGRKIGVNKALEKRKAAHWQPSMSKCKTCKSTLARPGLIYCQSCAYHKGICGMCGKQILDTSGYKQSAV